MKKTQRLDKVLVHLGYGSRKELKKAAKEGIILVNGVVVTDSSKHVDPVTDEIIINGEKINYRQNIYLMLNKPQGVISATEDRYEKTVIQLIDHEYRVFNPFPVGRLDKDTEGLLILTNDGKMAHDLLSPKKRVPKTYFALIKGKVTQDDVEKFKEGLTLDDGYITLPAQLTIKKSQPTSHIEVTIYEGKYHQVKRMFKAVNKEVTFLKRIKMGELELDSKLMPGEYRQLSDDELSILLQHRV